MRWELQVRGEPTPKGSYDILPHARPVVVGGYRHYRVRDMHLQPQESDRLARWKHAVELAVLEAGRPHDPPTDVPVLLDATFWFSRPKKTKYPDFPLGPPDADKLARAVGDFLQGIYYANDSQVEWGARKRYATEEHPEGATIIVEAMCDQKELTLPLD